MAKACPILPYVCHIEILLMPSLIRIFGSRSRQFGLYPVWSAKSAQCRVDKQINDRGFLPTWFVLTRTVFNYHPDCRNLSQAIRPGTEYHYGISPLCVPSQSTFSEKGSRRR